MKEGVMEKIKNKSAKRITETVKKIVGLKAAAAKVEAKKPVASVKQDDFFRRVQDKAYEIYVQRSCCHGNDLDDWYEAERLVRAEMKGKR